jgi:hypothetical protein
MRRPGGIRRQAALQLQAQIANQLLEIGNTLLLPGHGAVEFFEQVFVEAQFDFNFGEAGFVHGLHLFRRTHEDAHVFAFDLLAGTDLRRLATLGLPVDGNNSGGNQLFAAPAAVGNADQLQQVAEAHMVITQSEFTGLQGKVASLR